MIVCQDLNKVTAEIWRCPNITASLVMSHFYDIKSIPEQFQLIHHVTCQTYGGYLKTINPLRLTNFYVLG